MFVAVLAFVGLIAARVARRWFSALSRGQLQLAATAGLLLTVGLILFYSASGISIPKLGTAAQMVTVDRWMHFFESRVHGSAAYPAWTQPGSALDFLWAVPVRAVYLLFSPFPWDISRPAHVMGFVEGLFYLALVFLVWRHRAAIVHDAGARAILLLLVPLVFAFGVGTGNFGTGLRHRAKFVVALIVLAAPRLPRLVFRSRSGFAAHGGSPALPKQSPAQGT
jgi:hypothetical protein